MADQGAPCALCGCLDASPAVALPGRGLLRCRSCGLVRLDPMPSAERMLEFEERGFRGEMLAETASMYGSYGRNHDPGDPVVRTFRASLARIEALTPGRRLLDVGVGTGLYVALATERGWRAEGVEICAEAAARAAAEFGIPVRAGSFDQVALDGPYDAITMGDVIEHSRDPRRFVARARELLAPGGVLYVGVPNHAGTVFRVADALAGAPGVAGLLGRLYPENHYWYFTPRTLPRLLEQGGLRVVAVEHEDPHLGRYAIAWPMRVALATLLWLGRLAGRRNRLVVFAQKASG